METFITFILCFCPQDERLRAIKAKVCSFRVNRIREMSRISTKFYKNFVDDYIVAQEFDNVLARIVKVTPMCLGALCKQIY